MQQFTVPQFIDVEDKIIGPITSRQFVIMLVVGLMIVLNYKIFDFTGFLIVSVPEFGISLTIAFIKVNGRPFHFFILNLIQTFKRKSLRIWSNANSELASGFEEIVEATKAEHIVVSKPLPYRSSRLDEISLIVDTQGAYKGEK